MTRACHQVADFEFVLGWYFEKVFHALYELHNVTMGALNFSALHAQWQQWRCDELISFLVFSLLLLTTDRIPDM